MSSQVHISLWLLCTNTNSAYHPSGVGWLGSKRSDLTIHRFRVLQHRLVSYWRLQKQRSASPHRHSTLGRFYFFEPEDYLGKSCPWVMGQSLMTRITSMKSRWYIWSQDKWYTRIMHSCATGLSAIYTLQVPYWFCCYRPQPMESEGAGLIYSATWAAFWTISPQWYS